MSDNAAPPPALSKSEPETRLSAPASGSFSSPPSQSSGWRALAATVFQGATTLSVQIGALYFANKRFDDAFTALIEKGVWLPFVLLVGTVIAIVAPLTFKTVTDAVKALLPKRGD
jgi:hypothetical protein